MRVGPACRLVLAGLLTEGACQRSPDITGVRIVVEFGGLADQVELSVTPATGGGTALLPPTLRPQAPGAPLTSPADVVVYLPDSEAGNDVTCTARLLLGGAAFASASTDVRLQLHAIVTARLTAGADSGADLSGSDGGGGRPAGEPCTAADECASSFCVDGVCCDTACSGPCASCVEPGRVGTCSAVPAGRRTGDCPDEGAASCGRDGTCDGNGACRLYASGTRCLPASCDAATGQFTPDYECDGLGSCQLIAIVLCSPYRCDLDGCASSCAGDSDCITGSCTATTCAGVTLKPLGQPCTLATQCGSGICSDGVCCSTDCSGQVCRRCDASGSCAPVAAGLPDPRNSCTRSAVTSCGLDGACDGQGACRFWPAGTVCDPAGSSCGATGAARSMIYERRCDGTGAACPAAAMVMDCSPYACVSSSSGAVCGTSCSAAKDCAPGATCTNGFCGGGADAGARG